MLYRNHLPILVVTGLAAILLTLMLLWRAFPAQLDAFFGHAVAATTDSMIERVVEQGDALVVSGISTVRSKIELRQGKKVIAQTEIYGAWQLALPTKNDAPQIYDFTVTNTDAAIVNTGEILCAKPDVWQCFVFTDLTLNYLGPQPKDSQPDASTVLALLYDREKILAVFGRAQPNSLVQMYVGTGFVGAAKTNSDGDWRLNPAVAGRLAANSLRFDYLDERATVIDRRLLDLSLPRPGEEASSNTRIITANARQLEFASARGRFGFYFPQWREQKSGDKTVILPAQIIPDMAITQTKDIRRSVAGMAAPADKK